MLAGALIGASAIGVAPAQIRWEGPYVWFANQAGEEIEHAAVIGRPGPNQGKVIFVRNHVNSGLWLWDPAAPGTLQPGSDTGLDNMSCAGQSWDGDGELIFAGGDKNADCSDEPIWTTICDHEFKWRPEQNMLLPSLSPMPQRFGYYYPATVALHDGRVASLGGGSAPWRVVPCGPEPPLSFMYSDYWQVFDKNAGTWIGQGTVPDVPLNGLPGTDQLGAYPGVFLLSTGNLFLTHSTDGSSTSSTHRYAPSGWINVATLPPPPLLPWTMQSSANNLKTLGGQGINLLYPTGILLPYHIGPSAGPIVDQAMLIGGSDFQPGSWGVPPDPSSTQRLADNGVWVITNPTGGNPWIRGGSLGAQHHNLNHARVFPTAVILPDLTVMVFGGSAIDFSPGQGNLPGTFPPEVDAEPVLIPEMLDLLNVGAGWVDEPTPHVSPRLYHHVSLLLKDGRILVASGWKATVNQLPAPLVHTDAEIFTPPCIRQVQPRPVIHVAPASIGYGTAIPPLTISLKGYPANPANEIMFATLIRCGALTHHFTADQRCLRLDVTPGPNPDQITLATLPSQANGGHFIAPPGYYYLFIVTTPRGNPPVRVPSVAKFVHIG